MSWLVFSYSLPSKAGSSRRVSVWRRLQRVGAVTPKAGIFILPDREDSLESFQWLAQEVEEGKGEVLLMKVEKFEGMEDSGLIQLFQTARNKDYEKVQKEIKKHQERIQKDKKLAKARTYLAKIKQLHEDLADIAKIDYFRAPSGKVASNSLCELKKELKPAQQASSLPRYKPEDYRGKTWVTRPKPHVDRLGCIWLIRRFIDSKAKVRYASTAEKEEIPFDMKGALFGHRHGNSSFETMVKVFGFQDKALEAIGEIIHEIDLRDGRFHRPETEGVAAILKGWLLEGPSDQELEANGIKLYEGLYQTFKRS